LKDTFERRLKLENEKNKSKRINLKEKLKKAKYKYTNKQPARNIQKSVGPKWQRATDFSYISRRRN